MPHAIDSSGFHIEQMNTLVFTRDIDLRTISDLSTDHTEWLDDTLCSNRSTNKQVTTETETFVILSFVYCEEHDSEWTDDEITFDHCWSASIHMYFVWMYFLKRKHRALIHVRSDMFLIELLKEQKKMCNKQLTCCVATDHRVFNSRSAQHGK
jgi:hypothetical protein